MNLSTNKKQIVKTYDGVPLKMNMVVYVPNVHTGEIESYVVKYWHNGRNTSLYPPPYKHNYTCDLSGYGGAGFYISKEEYNPYSFIHCNSCYGDIMKARKRIANYAKTQVKFYQKIVETVMEK